MGSFQSSYQLPCGRPLTVVVACGPSLCFLKQRCPALLHRMRANKVVENDGFSEVSVSVPPSSKKKKRKHPFFSVLCSVETACLSWPTSFLAATRLEVFQGYRPNMLEGGHNPDWELASLLDDVCVPDAPSAEPAPLKKRKCEHNELEKRVAIAVPSKSAERLSSTTWAQRLRPLLRAHLAEQQCPVAIHSLCSGMATERHVMEVLQIKSKHPPTPKELQEGTLNHYAVIGHPSCASAALSC